MLRKYGDAFGPVEIVLMEGDQAQLREWLGNGLADLIVTYEIGPSFEEDCVTRICKVPTHAILSVSDPLAEQESVSLTELSVRPLVLLDLPLCAR